VGGDWTVLGSSRMFWSLEAFSSRMIVMRLPFSCCANSERGNSMGLILDARSSPLFSFGSIAYGKRRRLMKMRTQTLGLLSEQVLFNFEAVVSEALSKELDPRRRST